MIQNTSQLQITEKFLLGALSGEELCSFFQTLHKNSHLMQELYNESCFEAALYSQQWLERDSIMEDISGIISTDEPQGAAENDQKQGESPKKDLVFTNDIWQRIIDNAFSEAQKKVRPLFLMSYLFKEVKTISAGIGFLIIVSAALYVTLIKSPHTRYEQNSVKIALETPDKPQARKESPTVDSATNVLQATVSPFDTINEVRIASKAPQKFIIPPNNKSVVYLSEGSGFFAEHKAGIAVMVNTDSVVTISMKTGSAVFQIKKGAYKRFSVITPHFEVRVTGTVFEVVVSPHKSNITVLEGEVIVTTIQGTQEILTLGRGSAAYSSHDSLITDILQNSRMLKQRKSLLTSYLQYMHKSSIEQFPVDEVYDTLALKEKEIIDSLLTLSDALINARLMHFKAAHNSEKERLYEKAEKHFLQIFEEDQNDIVAQLALLRLCILSTHIYSYEKMRAYCEKYIDAYAAGFAQKEVMVLYIRNALAENDFLKVLPYMIQFVDLYPKSSFADDIAFNTAQIARQHLFDMSKALTYYEFVADNFPGSLYAEDAVYWAGWCFVQQQIHKNDTDTLNRGVVLKPSVPTHQYPAGADQRDNKFIRQYMENYPDGIWRSAISEK